jgi:hypothetical protein
VKTVAKEYHGCCDVTFHWFKEEALTLIDELFTEDEAKQLAAYLDGEDDPGLTTITEVSPPADKDALGYGAQAVGGPTDFYMLTKHSDYTLLFAVWGYFDLRGCQTVDRRGIFEDSFLEVDTRIGTARMVDEITPLN